MKGKALIIYSSITGNTEKVANWFRETFEHYCIQERTWNFYSDVQIDAIETWTGNCDGAWAFPNASLTTEESASISAATGDVCTYNAESIPRIIMGDYNLDTDWDSYVQTVHTMGMDQCLGAYQSALDRFNAR